jgi:mRNA interferase MazF
LVREYVPEAGDVVWVDVNPTVGHEQAGRRPALVLSRSSYNSKTSLMLACVLTKEVKGYPFEVTMPDGFVVLSDQIKCLDWRFRKIEFKEKAPAEVLKRVRELLTTLIF